MYVKLKQGMVVTLESYNGSRTRDVEVLCVDEHTSFVKTISYNGMITSGGPYHMMESTVDLKEGYGHHPRGLTGMQGNIVTKIVSIEDLDEDDQDCI